MMKYISDNKIIKIYSSDVLAKQEWVFKKASQQKLFLQIFLSNFKATQQL